MSSLMVALIELDADMYSELGKYALTNYTQVKSVRIRMNEAPFG